VAGGVGAATQFTSAEDGSGVQVEPNQLLIACFVFIVCVMAMHIGSKFIK
jgi:preprotein translocase subunit Sec61beta